MHAAHDAAMRIEDATVLPVGRRGLPVTVRNASVSMPATNRWRA